MSIADLFAFYLTASLASLVLSSPLSPCYYPDGTLRLNDAPCFPNQAESFCCGQGHSCMSNGLCRWHDEDMPPPLAYVRGSCTDQSWQSSACPQYCRNVSASYYSVIVACPDNEFCCPANNVADQTCCSASPDLFELAVATTLTVIGAPASTSTGSSTSSTTIETATGTASTTSTSAHRSNLGIGVGAGVGIGVFVLLLVLVGGWFCWRRRKRSTTSPVQKREEGRENVGGIIHERTEYRAELPSERYYDGVSKSGNLSYIEHSGRKELDGQERQELPG